MNSIEKMFGLTFQCWLFEFQVILRFWSTFEFLLNESWNWTVNKTLLSAEQSQVKPAKKNKPIQKQNKSKNGKNPMKYTKIIHFFF